MGCEKLMICINIKYDIVNSLCGICGSVPFDIDVVCGRYVVDGTSILGVMSVLEREVELRPVTDDLDAWEMFYERVKPLGAYRKGE